MSSFSQPPFFGRLVVSNQKAEDSKLDHVSVFLPSPFVTSQLFVTRVVSAVLASLQGRWSSQVGNTKNVVKKDHLGSVTEEEQAERLCCRHRLWDRG